MLRVITPHTVAQSGREFSTCGSDTKQFVSLRAAGSTAIQYPKKRVCVQAGGKNKTKQFHESS